MHSTGLVPTYIMKHFCESPDLLIGSHFWFDKNISTMAKILYDLYKSFSVEMQKYFQSSFFSSKSIGYFPSEAS